MVLLKNLIRKFKKKGDKEKKKVSTEQKTKIGGYEKEITDNRVVLFLIPKRQYQAELLHITKIAASKFSNILYISLNKPAEKVIEVLKENNIDTERFLFVDGITKRVKANVSKQGIIFIKSPKNFEQFKAELNEILKKERKECLILDSLNTMLIYKDASTVIKFIHYLIAKLMAAHASGEIICLPENINPALARDIFMFVDAVIDMGKTEADTADTGQEELKINEMASKLKNRLNSIRKAYAANFLSEQSYLETKKRIEKKLEKLRK